MRNIKTKICVHLMIIMTILLGGMNTLTVYADQSQEKVVKVGYWIMPGFQEGGEGEYKTGQSYEYLQKIAGYTGWTYEYVYGDFVQMEAKLEEGEIDLMANLSYTEARDERINYGQYEQGKESFYLYINGNESGIRAEDYSTINGKRIGVTKGLYQNELWYKWCEENGINCEVVEFASGDERQATLNAGEIDGTIGSVILNDSEVSKNWKSILKYADSPYYFGVNKNRPDLLEELNQAQGKILDENPYYNEELSTHYLRSGSVDQVQLKTDEIEWLKKHGGELKIGCLDNYLPLSDLDESGKMKGVIPDLLQAVEKNYEEYDVKFEPIVYNDYSLMIKDLKDGKIDLAAPIYGDYWNADQEGISLTNSFMSTTMLLLNEKNITPDKIQKIGIDQQSPIQSVYAEIYYPNYELVMYPSMTEVAKALVKGEVDVALSSACCYHINAIIDSNIKELNRSTLPNSVDLAMAVAKQNPELMSFMNRAIAMVGESPIYSSLAVNSNVVKKTTLTDYVSENPLAAIVISGVTIITLLIIIIRLKRAIQRARTDTMTGLLNKVATYERMKEEMGRGGTLFMIDIDNFKMVNDVLGHTAGDQVICHFADGLQSIFRSGDIIGRFGGDEFIVFLPGSPCKEELIQRKVEQMRENLEESETLKNSQTVSCSVSVGVLLLEPNNSESYSDAFEKVDTALYEAKKNGKNKYVIAQ